MLPQKLDASIVICALARDCAGALEKNIPRIEQLRECFTTSAVVVIENDSKDATKSILQKWAQQSGSVNIISSNYNELTIPVTSALNPRPQTSIQRIQKMCMYRNQYINWISSSGVQYDYVLMIDIDVYAFSVNDVLNAILNAPANWGGLFGFGYTDSKVMGLKFYKIFHDLYAFLETPPLSKPYLTYGLMFKNAKRIRKLLKNNSYIPVASAFGGIGIYKYESIKGLSYESINNEDVLMEAVCEHIPFNTAVLQRGYQNYIATTLKVYYGNSTHLAALRNFLPDPLFKLLALLFTFKKLKA